MIDRRGFLAGGLAGVSVGVLGGASAAAYRQREKAGAAHPGAISYSQMGEDLIAYHLLRDAMGIRQPTYVDIGAADPIEANNTYLLHANGGHGVLVEPNPAYVERLRLERPHDVVVNAGVGVSDAAEADYYVIRGAPMRNTFSKDDVEDLRTRRGHEVVERVIKMPLVSINRLMAEHLGGRPDLLSIDVEGLDLEILRRLDFEKYRPAVVIAETEPGGPIPALLGSRGYKLRGATMNNVIFADPGRYVRA